MEEAVRWTIRVSKETDLTLRSFLGPQGVKKDGLSRFIEQAVRAYIFHRTIQDIKARNAETDQEALQTLIDDSVREVRSSKRPRGTRKERVKTNWKNYGTH